MAAQTTLEYVEGWLDITIDKFHEALDDYDVGQLDGDLWRSIMGEVIRSGQEPNQVIIKFLQYGRFRDMRVGRSRPMSSAKQGLRKKAPWFSKTKTREIARLRELLATNLVDRSIEEVHKAFSEGINIYT